jgi:C4-type Zn-finger protein
MSDFYPLATGRMAQVWAQCICPVCDNEMTHIDDEYEDDDAGKLHLDTYACAHCSLLVTYVSPANIHEYHQVPDSKRRYHIERSW